MSLMPRKWFPAPAERVARAPRPVLRPSLAVCAVLACGLLTPPQAVQAQAPQPTQSADRATLLPQGFAGISLGTNQTELRRLRPAIADSGFRGDNVGHAKMLMERVGSTYIDQAIYLFEAEAPVLTGILFVKALPVDALPATRSFRAAVVQKWGTPTGTGVMKGEGGEQEVMLVWRRPDGIVTASYPTEAAAMAPKPGRPRAATVRIGATGSEVDKLAGRRQALDAAEARRLEAELQQDASRSGSAAFR